MTYSLELIIDAGDKATQAFKEVKRFDKNLLMGKVLQLMREREPLVIDLQGIAIPVTAQERIGLLYRLIDLLDELMKLEIPYELTANNVPKDSKIWEASPWDRSDVVEELKLCEERETERQRTKEWLKNKPLPPTPEPSASTKLFWHRSVNIAYSDLLPSEQKMFCLASLRSDVEDAGFTQYFDYRNGDNALQALDALASFGLSEAHAILSEAIALFAPGGEYPTNVASRMMMVDAAIDDALEALTDRYRELSFDDDGTNAAWRAVEADYESQDML